MAGKKASIPFSTVQAGSGQCIRVALYCRVSTNTGQQSPEMQIRELREYAERRGWMVADEYTDQGVSGAKESRPALNRLMVDAHRRRFDAVLVWNWTDSGARFGTWSMPWLSSRPWELPS